MNKKEVNEIKKQFTPERCTITRICGCYVDSEKNKKTELAQTFLTLSEEENYKYFKLFKSTLSGTIGKNLLNLEFPVKEEQSGGKQEVLLKLKNLKLENAALVEQFYNTVIDTYNYPEHYYIVLVYGVYDIPGRSSDGFKMEDASEDVYDFILCSICPVKLSQEGLSYHEKENVISTRVRDWVVSSPAHGFLFPAFNDRMSDIHSALYYSKNAEQIQEQLIDDVLGCVTPKTASCQKETFKDIIETSLGSDCTLDTIKVIQENVDEYVESRSEGPEEPIIDKMEMRKILENSGVKADAIEAFNHAYDTICADDENKGIAATTIASAKKMEISLPEVEIKVSAERTDLVEIREIDGIRYVMIEATDQVKVNGIQVLG